MKELLKTACVAWLVGTALAGSDTAIAEPARVICREAGRYIGWPTVCRRANGELLIVFSGDRIGHVCPFGKVQLVRSTDGGETWSKPETIQTSIIDCRDAGLVELKDGTLVLNWFTSVAYKDKNTLAETERGRAEEFARHYASLPLEKVREALGYWVARSTDGGRTWSKPVRTNAQRPHAVTLLRNGRLLAVGRCYASAENPSGNGPSRDGILCEESTDGGQSWRVIAELKSEEGVKITDLHEPHLAELPDGRLVAQLRWHGFVEPGKWGGLVQAESADGGRTWTTIHKTPIVGFPPHLIVLKDGRLMTTYGRRPGGCGVFARLSEDGGRTWDAKREICIDRIDTSDFGYPSTVQLDDDTFLTAWYQAKPKTEKTCLVAAKWKLKSPVKTVTIGPIEGNATPAVVEAVRKLPDGGTLRFAKGEYHFYEEGTRVKTVMAGANSWGEKKLLFDFEEKTDITIDGGGSTFVWHGNIFPFAFSKCRGVTVGNFTARAFRPSYVELKIEKYEEDGSFVFRFNDGVAYRVKDGGILIETDLGLFDSRERIVSVHALERCSIHYLFAANEKTARDKLPSTFLNGVAEDLGGGRVRISNRRQQLKGCLAKFPFKVGEPLCFLLNGRERCSLFVNECRDVRIHDVWLQSGDGMGIVSLLNENVTIDRYRVEPREGDHVSITADCLYVVNNRGKVDVRNSVFSWALDDAINMHGNYQRLESVTGNTLELSPIHASCYSFPPFHPGDTVEFSDPASHDVLQTAKVVSVEPRARGVRLVIDGDASMLAKGTLVEDLTWLPEVNLHDNVFHDVMHMRLSGRGKYVVERNVFRRGLCLLISDLSTYWGEAGRTGDMTIRDNEFDSFSSRGGYGSFIVCEVEGRGERVPKIHRGICIEGNRVRGLPKDVEFASLPCALDPVVRDNIILDDGAAIGPSPLEKTLPAVSVGGKALRVEPMRCSAMPVNIRWPGHQREKDQTEICFFARFDLTAPVEVVVTAPRAFTNAAVRPLSKKVAVTREGDEIRFTLAKPGAYSVEFDGRHENLMIFADKPRDYSDCRKEATGMSPQHKSIRYFGPGEHDVGLITMRAGETLFIDEGAVVYGRIEARDAPGIRICGKGILDASRVKEVPVAIDPKLAEEQRRKGWAITNVKRFNTIDIHFCDNVRIEGITIRDSQIYAIRPVCCNGLTVENVKILGSWRYNSDGIDMHNCRHVRIRDSFIRTYDDSICVKGFDYCLPESEMTHNGVVHDLFEDVLVERCTIWNDWGRALEIGAETRAREIKDVMFRDCDILAVHDVALDVQNCDQAHVHDIRYENIRVEYDPNQPKTVYSASAKDFDPASRRAPAPLAGCIIHYIPEYSKAGAANRGRTTDIIFRNIDVYAPTLPGGFLRGFDRDHRVERVTFEAIRLNGKDVTDAFRRAVSKNNFAE